MKLDLYEKCVESESGCYQWRLSKNKFGYGKKANGNGGWVLAHRAAWESVHGPIPAGLEVCHRCDNPACIRIEHLFVGTHAENMRDSKSKGRSSRLKGEANGRSKLTEQDVRLIRKSMETSVQLAKRLMVSSVLVSRIRLGKSWTHVA